MFKRFLLVILAGLFLSACTIPGLGGGQKSGLQVTSTPQATVYLDGNSLGLTPVLEETLKPGEYTIKLVPSDTTIQPWEAKITLQNGVLTVIDRKLSAIPDQSSGYILSFEKLNNKKGVQLAVTTLPDSVTVSVDGKPEGFTPVSLDTVDEGDHTILLSSPGFEDKLVRARAVKGFRLTITSQLAKKAAPPVEASPSAEATPSSVLDLLTPTPSKKITPTPTKKATTATPSATIAKPYVEIQDTPTGFLRVREQPSSGSPELAQVAPGERFPYLNETTNGWHKLEYVAGKVGYVSGQYATVVK